MTETRTPAIADFLLARIAQAQRHAEALWVTMQSDSFTCPASLINLGALLDPRKVIAECEAKRRIIELHHPVAYTAHGADDEERDGVRCSACFDSGTEWFVSWPCLTLRLLALPYADRPGYRSGWRP